MQNVTAKGCGGGNDYSNWTYTYTEKYHTIAPGINELTSKIICFDNPNNITSKYYSINVTGLKNDTMLPTLPSSTSSNITFGYHNLDYLPQYDGLFHNIFQPTVRDESSAQHSSNNNNGPDDNKDDTNNDDDGDSSKDEDSQSQSNSHSVKVDNNGVKSSSEDNDDDSNHNREQHSDKHEKKDSHNNENKDKAGEKHKGAHSKNMKARTETD